MEQWSTYESTPGKRDYRGYKNTLRLWLNKFEFIDTARMKYIDGFSLEGSERKKNATAAVVDAARLHVHDKFSVPHGVGHGHAFLQGKASAGSGAAAGKPDGEQDGEEHEEDAEGVVAAADLLGLHTAGDSVEW